MRAMNGLAATDRGTIAAIVPMLVPTINRESGRTITINMMNGNDRSTLMIRSAACLAYRNTGDMPDNLWFDMMNRPMPTAPPAISAMLVDAMTITSVSISGLARRRATSSIHGLPDESPGTVAVWIFKNATARAVFNNPALGYDGYVITNAADHLKLVRNHDDCQTKPVPQ